MADLTGIAIFTNVARLGGFTAAAKAMGLSKSTVSKQIARLEDRLGARLFNRTTRRLALTEIGAAYFERCRRIVEEAEEAELAVTQMHSEPVGTLRINAPVSFGLLHVAPLLGEFMSRHPAIEVAIDVNDRRVDLIEEGLDVAIRIGDLADSSLVARRLAPCRFAVVASPAYWARHAKPDHPSQLSGHNVLIYTLRERPEVMRFLDPAQPETPISVNVSGTFRANNGDMLLSAALAGSGVYVCPTFFCGEHLAAGRLEAVLEGHPPPATAVHAVWPPNRHLSAKVRAFVDFLAERLGPEPYWDSVWSATTRAISGPRATTPP